MRVFSSYPVGCIRMKNIEQIWTTLSELNKSKKVFSEVKEEIGTILDSLKPLEKSEPIKATGKSFLTYKLQSVSHVIKCISIDNDSQK